ncbi:hypothetical protein EJ06DRAFT_531030 [Trichodelitschia bisporula]|uniref:Uncharacterized protein n=1 Tax=Trichodelitschia bisporula TaxID=703511 RepID=A0A6G1HUI7_9PEZI|nr:hypothetical protein EJ06DRAFT_531030 [Trichodelitschia bisporula]
MDPSPERCWEIFAPPLETSIPFLRKSASSLRKPASSLRKPTSRIHCRRRNSGCGPKRPISLHPPVQPGGMASSTRRPVPFHFAGEMWSAEVCRTEYGDPRPVLEK